MYEIFSKLAVKTPDQNVVIVDLDQVNAGLINGFTRNSDITDSEADTFFNKVAGVACEIFKNTFFYRTPPVAASEITLIA